MVRFFFHVYEQGRLIPDEEGSLCADLDAAKTEAKASARDLARQALSEGQTVDDICVEIHDEGGRVLAALTIREILSHPDHPNFDSSCAASGHGLLN
jgi:hypothetical protein